MNEPAVELDSVERVFRSGSVEVRALAAVSVTIPVGSITSVVGPSGSGKTTLLNTIVGLDRPTSGRCAVLGTELDRLDDDAMTRWRRDHVAFVFQAKGLVSQLTAFENVELALRLVGTPRDERRTRADDMLERVGLSAFADHRPAELSGGQQQRVAIARALVRGAPLLVADEPTGELDSETAAEMISLITDHVRGAGTTALVATHDPAFAAVSDRVLHLVDGQLIDGERE